MLVVQAKYTAQLHAITTCNVKIGGVIIGGCGQ